MLFALTLTLASPALAQTPGGTVTGAVRDEQGAAVPGSDVTVRGSDATFRFTTTAEGTFRFLDLPPGPYTLSAALSGFQPASRDIVVAVGKTVVAPLELRVAPVAESVTVSAARADCGSHGNRHVHDVLARRADDDSDVTRSVCRAAHGARRAARPREHRRQRNRPGAEHGVEGHAPAGHGLDARRHRHHRHGRGRPAADVLQLRQLPGNPGVDRRPGHLAGDRRRRRQPRDPARHESVPRRRAGLLRERRVRSVERPGRAAVDGDAGHGRSHQAGLRRRGRVRRAHPVESRLVLRVVFVPGHPALPQVRFVRGQDGAEEPRSEAELAGHAEGHAELRVLQRLEGEGLPEPRRGGHPHGRADGDLSSGQRVHRLPAAGSVEDRGRPRRQPEPLPVREVRLLQHRQRPDAHGRHGHAGRTQPDDGPVVRLDQPGDQRATAADGSCERALVRQDVRPDPRPRVRLGLPDDRLDDVHRVAGQRHPRDGELADGLPRPGVPPGQRRQPRELLRHVHRRHDLEGPRDDQRRPALRPAVGTRAREHDRRATRRSPTWCRA